MNYALYLGEIFPCVAIAPTIGTIAKHDEILHLSFHLMAFEYFLRKELHR
jgi:hypothetical protein